ncbi:MAG: hypothetical protein V4488_22795 [Pseudomonadota bacterium]
MLPWKTWQGNPVRLTSLHTQEAGPRYNEARMAMVVRDLGNHIARSARNAASGISSLGMAASFLFIDLWLVTCDLCNKANLA